MQNDSELEEMYISRSIFENKAKIKKLHENIKVGSKVRFINEYENKLKKIRYLHRLNNVIRLNSN